MDHAETMRRIYELTGAGDIDGFGELVAEESSMTFMVLHQRRLLVTTLATLVATTAAVTVAASGAMSPGPQGPSCGTFKVLKDEKIEDRLFPKGNYRLNAIGISCAKVMGKYGLFDQFLSQEDTTPLPKPWKSLIGAVGAPKFSAAPGVGFRAQRISD